MVFLKYIFMTSTILIILWAYSWFILIYFLIIYEKINVGPYK